MNLIDFFSLHDSLIGEFTVIDFALSCVVTVLWVSCQVACQILTSIDVSRSPTQKCCFKFQHKTFDILL